MIQLFLVFLKLSSVTFGGGVTMMPILDKEVVEKRRWLSIDELAECFALAQSVPGVIAVNVAVYIGKRIRGAAGAAAAAAGAVLPAMLGILLMVWLVSLIDLKTQIGYALDGVKSASVALICGTCVTMVRNNLRDRISVLVFIVLLACSLVLGWNAIAVVGIAALCGVISFLILKRKKVK